MLRFFKSPFGLILTAAILALAASPEARKKARSLAVKGTASILGLFDRVRDSTSEVQEQLASLVKEARSEQSLTEEPEINPES
ncbi:hypothetical protein E0485_17290 [Paenibacillus albiflavus]|uniref:YtxH domain-containing protein n=1 Tax=Paenibacillus albiflavus TaxID=2545760 RepID=A0A4R4EC32_9BACL|nr:hypothetical protein [Paenibacillus albiflavus]TCZ75485.1 hypothetical protein E0485_17290 [Paenibacillus albiflavus]